MASLIFLSHIHEETLLAQIIQRAIEDEFSGFVDVFVSSDGRTIPPGANFLKRIEDGLINCVGAIYLISPFSVKRNWINFELGAVWIRNSLSIKSSGPEIPAIPICHSGITPSQLPMPLTNLNAIEASNSAQLELAFKSIQNAVGGKGSIKTNFDNLAQQIIQFEKKYTLGDNLIELFKSFGISHSDIVQVINQCKGLGRGQNLQLNLGFRDNSFFQLVKALEGNELHGHISVSMQSAGVQFGTQGAVNGGDITVNVKTNIVLDFETELLGAIK